MLVRLSSTILFSAFAMCATVSPAQQGAPVPATAANKIYLDVVVTPTSGAQIPGLQAKDFSLLDNKVAQPISSFSPDDGHGNPTEMILLVDGANSSYETIADARHQITNFLLAHDGQLAYPTKIAVLTDTGIQLQKGSTRDGKALDALLSNYTVALRSIRHTAGFYGAIERQQLSLRALSSLAAQEQGKPGRKIVLWVSQGWPLLASPEVQVTSEDQKHIFRQIAALSTQLRNARMTIYSIDPLGSSESPSRANYYKDFVNGVTKPSQAEPANLGLQVLATQTGGLALASDNDLAALLERAVNDSKSHYEISFNMPPGVSPDEYHQLHVEVAKPGVVARTRMGYYTQP